MLRPPHSRTLPYADAAPAGTAQAVEVEIAIVIAGSVAVARRAWALAIPERCDALAKPRRRAHWGPALLLAVAACSAAMAQGCGPGQMGNPCAQGDVAVQGALAPEADLGIGNPVHLATGNKYLFEEDLPASPSSPLLALARHYNSLDPRHGPLGRGWALSYDTRLYRVGRRIQIVQADGSRLDFPVPDAGSADHARTPRGRLYRQGLGWAWLWPDGRRLDFDAQGRLSAVRAAIPRPGLLRIQRHDTGLLHGLIARLSDEQGNEARLHYRIAAGQAYLDSLETPQGRWRYRYDSAGEGRGMRLTAVERPDGLLRRYLYEAARQNGNPWLPTGIAVAASSPAAPIRIRSWAYDAAGRVIEASHHPSTAPQAPGDDDWPQKPAHSPPGRPAITLHYQAPAKPGQDGQTLLQTAGGRRLALHTRSEQGRYTLPDSVLSVGKGAPDAPEGWPGLTMHYDAAGRLSHWHSPLTGGRTLRYDEQGRLAQVESSAGERWQYGYDDTHRLLRLSASRKGVGQHIRLHWHQNRLAAIEHPAEREDLVHDEHGRLVQRRVTRPALPGTGQTALRYEESFEYDAQGRLTAHHLPEGGALHYQWEKGRVARLEWHDRQGRRHLVLYGLPRQAGYRHGNGLHTLAALHAGPVFSMTVTNGATPIWAHLRGQDTQGRVTHLADWYGARNVGRGWRLHYDAASRLARAIPVILPPAGSPQETLPVVATPHTRQTLAHEHWYAWRPDGGLIAGRHNGTTHRPKIERAADGLPARLDGRRLRYDPTGRLEQVSDSQGRTARYTHNAHGYRISARYEMGRDGENAATPGKPGYPQSKQYLYVGHRLAAEIGALTHDGPQPHTGAAMKGGAIGRRYLYAGQTLAGFIDYRPDAPDGQLYAVHADPLGTPRLITDAQGSVRWLAEHSPTGELLHRWGDLDFDMRLPGQIADPLTGWHDNLLRTYAPAMGAYLEPDPLGPLPDQQALGYARQQPHRYTDPTGLILFAFDGTRQAAVSRANVWKMSQRYADGPAHYHAGPGNPYYMNNDALVASKAGDILDTQWQRLLESLQAAPANETQAIDIIGYSRGAALARHFGNMIASRVEDGRFRYDIPGQGTLQACVDLRFMGLFDTVAQFGLNGALNHLYTYTISPEWTRVAHAVALHEYRAWFPLTSVTGSNRPGVVEAPFVGAHANIGGGLGLFTGLEVPVSPGDLADVSLNWMLWQARIAGVGWVAGPLADREVTDPLLHDYRPGALRWISDGDRHVDSAFGVRLAGEQGVLDALGARHRQAAEPFIRRFDDWRTREGTAVGEVDMAEYGQWLRETLDWALP